MAVQTADQISASIISQLRAEDQAISAEIGTPERKFIDAVSVAIAQSQVDFSVLDSQFNIDTMSGGRLDAFGSLFGFGRQTGTAATGTVTFARDTPAAQDIIISAGVQVQAPSSDAGFPDVVFTVTQTVTLAVGTSEVDAPVQCSLPGTIGNIAANSITGFAGLRTVVGITSITNLDAMEGGSDSEDDDVFRIRIKNSIFRNMAGTESQFLALALSGEATTKAVVLGPVSRYREYIQVPAVDDTQQATNANIPNYDPAAPNFLHKRTTPASTVVWSKYTYDANHFVSDGSQGPDAKFFRPFVDYFFNRKAISATSNPRAFDNTAVGNHQPNVTFLNPYDVIDNPSGNLDLAENTVVLLEHQYISTNSRNDPTSGIMNAVDVFVNGSKLRTAKSVEVFPPVGHNLQNMNPNVWTYQHPSATTGINFRRILDGSAAAVGSRVLPCFWQPAVDVPDTIVIKSSGTPYTFYKGRYVNAGTFYYDAAHTRVANYVAVEEVNGYRGTIRARNGIEFLNGTNTFAQGDAAGSPSGPNATDGSFVGSQFTISYQYDANIADLQAIMEQNKQITTDVLVHGATVRYFKVNLVIMYAAGSTPSVVNAAINVALGAFFESQYFGVPVQLSDVLQVVHNVPGVDNVKFNSTHSIEEVSVAGASIGPIYHDADFFLKDNELAASPTANQTQITVRAQNTWNS